QNFIKISYQNPLVVGGLPDGSSPARFPRGIPQLFIIAGGWPLIFKICYAPDAVLTRILLCQMVWYTLIVANM
ncbi:hypothetical protein ACAF95_25770, partial [Escherichia coli]|uniref:hypothetical protein n=1 Tax=Escherichia coli TaxID=562 RepID=UPI003FA1019F